MMLGFHSNLLECVTILSLSTSRSPRRRRPATLSAAHASPWGGQFFWLVGRLIDWLVDWLMCWRLAADRAISPFRPDEMRFDTLLFSVRLQGKHHVRILSLNPDTLIGVIPFPYTATFPCIHGCASSLRNHANGGFDHVVLVLLFAFVFLVLLCFF